MLIQLFYEFLLNGHILVRPCFKLKPSSIVVFTLIIIILYSVDFVIYAPDTLLTAIKYGSVPYQHLVLFIEDCGIDIGDYSLSRDMDKGLSQCVETLLSNNSSSRRITAREQSSVLLELLNSAFSEFNNYVLHDYHAGEDLHIKFAALFDAVESSKSCTAHVCHLDSITSKAIELNLLLEHFNITERATFRLPHLFIGSVGVTIFICILLIDFLLRLALCLCYVLRDVIYWS